MVNMPAVRAENRQAAQPAPQDGQRGVGLHGIERPEGERTERALQMIDLPPQHSRVIDVQRRAEPFGEVESGEGADVEDAVCEVHVPREVYRRGGSKFTLSEGGWAGRERRVRSRRQELPLEATSRDSRSQSLNRGRRKLPAQ